MAAEPETILLVDDNPTNLQVLLQTLDGQGYNMLVAKSGETALDIARKTHPSVILLDIMMPGIDGFETCRRLKADATTRDAAVIFLSALDETADKVRGLELGAVDYITKPIQGDEVIARVNTHLTIRRLNVELKGRYDVIERELEIVADVQRGLLPAELPAIPGLSLAAFYATSRYAGGDYYDVIPLPDDRWGILMADVSGHGTRSAVVMAMTSAIFHAYPCPPTDPADLLCFLNRNLRRISKGSFVTAIYAIYHPETRTLHMARAGHEPPLLYRPGQPTAEELEVEGVLPLGLFDYDEVPTASHTLQPGDRLLFYTDGIPERFDPQQRPYGHDRLAQQLARCGTETPRQTLDAIMRDVNAFAKTRPPDDDQTLLLATVA